MVSITVAIPAFNEEETLEKVANEAISAMKKITSDYELLLVNDGSTDQTAQIMEKLAQKDRHIKIIHHQKNQGFSGAITTCLKNGSKDLIFLGPADGQFAFSKLVDFVKAIEGYDVVLGYRIKNAEPIYRQIQSKVYHLLARIFFGINFKEITTVTLWRKKALDELEVRVDPRSNTALIDFTYQAIQKGYKFNHIPIVWHRRLGGKAKGNINPFLIFSTLTEMVKLYLKTR